ncbi:hypothetical protein GGR57DRAFT_470198 [Xylariaceae sp. FL1272]|nr:hypothetical protein GGR57DRAFT_470198 [Xylariaceae sp. FL1272]
MCHADVSLVTMQWKNSTIYPVVDSHTERECIIYDKLSQWQKSRARNIEAGSARPPLLGHPVPAGRYNTTFWVY